MSDQEPSSIEVHYDPDPPVYGWTRKNIRRRRWFARLLFFALAVFFVIYFIAGYGQFYIYASLLILAAGLLDEFKARRFLFCPDCEILLATAAKRFPYAFCGKCNRLLYPERILKNHPGPVDLNTIVDHPEVTAKLVGMVLLFAILEKSREIAFEPTLEKGKLRYDRASGTHYAPVDEQLSIVATVKRFAGMDCWTYDRPQSGNIRLVMKDWSIECVAESQMHELGERIVIRFPEYDPPPEPDFVLQPGASNFLSAYPETFR